MNNSHRKVRMLTEGALCIALAEILSFLPLYKMPWGGSVDLSMLPIILFCVRWGFGPGMVVSFAHAVFQMLLLTMILSQKSIRKINKESINS